MTMASKSNIRSIRISDDMLELIEQQAGNNFTEKWENLVTRCVWELPAQEQRLEEVERQIQHARERLKNLHELYRKLNSIYTDLNRKTTTILQSVNLAIRKLYPDA